MENSSTNKPDINYSRKIILPILLLVLLGVVLVILDGKQIIEVLRLADWRPIPGTFFFVAFSYLCISYSYVIIAHLWGIQMGARDLAETCFTTTVMNHIVRSGGLAGYSVRYLIMKQHGVSLNDVLSSSFMHFYLSSLDMLVMLPVGIAYVFLTIDLPRGIAVLLGVLTVLSAFFAFLFTLVIFNANFRRWLADIASWFVRKVAHRDVDESLYKFNRRMTYGTKVLRQHPWKSLAVILLVFMDWWASVIAFGFCLDAFGPALPIGAVVAVFVIGIMAGVVSALPGGIGVQEGAMTGLAVLLGATFEQAILAAMLFRVVYYFIPYLLSPLFYMRLLRAPASSGS